MFWNKKTRDIEGFGNVKWSNDKYYESTIDFLGKSYEIEVYMDTESNEDGFTDDQQDSLRDFVEKSEKIQESIRQYYLENYMEIIEDYYIAFGENWSGKCRCREDFDQIMNSYNSENTNSLEILLSYFQLRSIHFFKNGNYALFGFLAKYDDHGIAIAVKPQWEIMTQDEYYNENMR